MIKERKCTEDTYALLLQALTSPESVHTGADVKRSFRGGCKEGPSGHHQTFRGRDDSTSHDQIEQLGRLLQQPRQSHSNTALQLRVHVHCHIHPAALPTDIAGNTDWAQEKGMINLKPSEEQEASSQDKCNLGKRSGCFPANLAQPPVQVHVMHRQPSRALVMQVLTQMSRRKANTAKDMVNNCQMIKDFSHC